MAFIRRNLSPVGANARKGTVPSKWSYQSEDTLAVIKALNYFPGDNTAGDINGMRGIFSPNDIIDVISELPASPISGQTVVPAYNIIRIAGDGVGPGILTVTTDTVGASYTAGDRILVIFATGTVLRNVIIVANDATVTAPTILDPGRFDAADQPTTILALATLALDAGGDDNLLVDITITSEPVISTYALDITEA